MSESSAGDAMATAAAVAVGWRRAGIAGAAIGVVAAGAAAGVAVERLTVGRGMRRKARLALDAVGPVRLAARHARPGAPPTTAPSCTTRSTDDRTAYGRGHRPGRRRRRRSGRAAPALRPQGPRARHRRLQPRLLPQPGLLALPAGGAARRWCAPCTGTSAATAAPSAAAAQAEGATGHHRPARPGPEGGHRRRRARGPAGAGRALDGRHDGHGARRPVPASWSADRVAGVALRRHVARASSARSASGCRSRA